MAKIYEAPNQGEREIHDIVNTMIWEKREQHRESAKRRPVILTMCAVGLILCGGLLAAMIFLPGFREGIGDWVKQLLRGWAEFIWSYQPDPESLDKPFLERVLWGLVEFVFQILLVFLGGAVYLLSMILPFVVIVLIFVAAGAGVFFALCAASDSMHAFNEEEERKWILEHPTDRMQQLQSGIDGERTAMGIIERLGDGCHVFSNLDIHHGHGHNETDFITVTPTGITVVEVKNYVGTIRGDLSDEKLIHVKYSRKGHAYEDTCRNPVLQVEVPATRVASFLRKHGIHANVRRCVLFTNDDVHVEVTDRSRIADKCAMFTRYDPKFLEYLHDPRRRGVLSEKDIQDIVRVLMLQM